MKATMSIKGLMLLVMGLAVLTTGGCLGGDKNFTSSASAAPASQAAGTAHPDVGTKIGNQAPDFTLKTLDGATIHLSDYRGKPVLVNFWASWCPPCKAEMPDIEQSYQKHKDEGYVFLGIDNAEDSCHREQLRPPTEPLLLDVRPGPRYQGSRRLLRGRYSSQLLHRSQRHHPRSQSWPDERARTGVEAGQDQVSDVTWHCGSVWAASQSHLGT